MDKLLETIKDESIDFETRYQAAYCYGLLLFAERIDDHTVRITKDTEDKLQTYIAMLRLQKEMAGE